MAERSHWWTERCLRSPLFLSRSLSFSDYLPTYLPIDLCVSVSIYLSSCLSILSVCLSVYLSNYQSISSVYLTMYLSISTSTYLSIHLSLSVCLSTCLSASLKTKLFCETSSGLELDNLKNGAILWDFLNVWTWQRQKQNNSARCLEFSKLTTSKRSNSARLPQFLNLTTSKTKQFCETSFFELDNIQNEAILRDFFKFWTWQHQNQSNSARLPSKIESWVQRWRPRTNAFCDFSTPPV